MRAESAIWRLSFILPDKLYRTVRRGPVVPCLHGSLLTVHGAGLAVCEGRPLAVVLEQAMRFLRSQRLASIHAMLDDGDRRTVGQLNTRPPGFTVSAQLDLPMMGVTDNVA